jgi:alpha-amylase
MVDVVVNHFAWNGNVASIQYNTLTPFNQQSNYHFPYCTIDFNNMANQVSLCVVSLTWTKEIAHTAQQTQIQDCWMGDQSVPLLDIRTEDQGIQATYNDWIKDTVSRFSIDGLRLDTVMEVNTGFWK